MSIKVSLECCKEGFKDDDFSVNYVGGKKCVELETVDFNMLMDKDCFLELRDKLNKIYKENF